MDDPSDNILDHEPSNSDIEFNVDDSEIAELDKKEQETFPTLDNDVTKHDKNATKPLISVPGPSVSNSKSDEPIKKMKRKFG